MSYLVHTRAGRELHTTSEYAGRDEALAEVTRLVETEAYVRVHINKFLSTGTVPPVFLAGAFNQLAAPILQESINEAVPDFSESLKEMRKHLADRRILRAEFQQKREAFSIQHRKFKENVRQLEITRGVPVDGPQAIKFG